MAIAAQRDLEVIASGVASWLTTRRRADKVTVTRCERPVNGLSSETLMVDARVRVDGADGDESIVVRLAPTGAAAFPEYDLAVQARAQEIAAAHGIPAPTPADYEADVRWLGAPFLVMPAIAGHVPGSMPIRDRWITESVEAATRVSTGLYELLARIHRVDWRAAGLDVGFPRRGLDAELAYWGRYLDWFTDGRVPVPTLTDALAWCRAHRPEHEPPPALLWGDVRLGNIIFAEDRTPLAVLDWEMTTIGAPEHDVAWQLTLEATQNELFGRAVPGFLDHDAARAHYETAAGRSLQDLEWFEVLAMVRSTAIMTRLAYVEEQAGNPAMLPLTDNPLLDLVERRIAEWSSS